MIVSDALTIGQMTFILRVGIQILAYGGLGLIGIIILGSAPRVAPIDTHDVINRVVGASSVTPSTAKWIFSRIRRNNADPSPPTNLLLILFLFISYTAFVSISDVGFLGFYSCSVPGSTIMDYPASVSSDDAARSLTSSFMVNGTDPSKVKAYRCDSTETVQFFENVSESNCTSWHNSTYADGSFYAGLNSTDSAVLMPRQFAHYDHPKAATFDLNSYYIGPGTQRLTNATIHNGLAVDPHETGLTVVVGVPQLAPDRKVDIPKTLALEVDVGCMTLGIYAQHNIQASGIGINLFQTNGTWRTYTGPDYMRDVLTKTADDIRAYYQPFFNQSTLDSKGFMEGINDTDISLSSAANIRHYTLLTNLWSNSSSDQSEWIIGNCTDALQKQLGISKTDKDIQGNMCGFLGMGGSAAVDGVLEQIFSRMICATATQVNMVSATVKTDSDNQVSVNVTRLPSDLHYLRADYWDASTVEKDNLFGKAGDIQFNNFDPYERFTLSDNPQGSTTHFVRDKWTILGDDTVGPGSAGIAISRMGPIIIGTNGQLDDLEYTGLGMLPDGFNQIKIKSSDVTRWVGQVSGSYVLASLGYSGWAARDTAPLQVISTGGHVGSCYKPQYALGFLPLVFSALVVLCWVVIMMFQSALFGSRPLKEAYGGMNPYVDVVCPGAAPKEVLLAWESSPEPHLQVVSKGTPIMGDAHGTALQYLKSAHSYP